MFDAIVHRRIDLEGLEFSVSPGGRRSAEPGGVCRRGRRHQAELPRVRVLRRPATCCSTPAARSAGTADRCSISKRPISQDEVAAGHAPRSRFPADTRPPTSCSAWRFQKRADKTELVFSAIEPALLDGEYRRRAHHPREPVHLRSEGPEEDHRPRRILGGARPARRSRSAASSSSGRCRTT